MTQSQHRSSVSEASEEGLTEANRSKEKLTEGKCRDMPRLAKSTMLYFQKFQNAQTDDAESGQRAVRVLSVLGRATNTERGVLAKAKASGRREP